MAKRNLGPSNAARLDAWVRAFSKRSDVAVKDSTRGPTWKGAPNSILEPKELDGFYSENNGYSFVWLPTGSTDQSEGGILRIPKRSGSVVLWYKDPGHHEVSPYIDGLIIDEPTDENTTFVLNRYIAGTRKKERVIGGNNASSNEARFFESFSAYLQEGARKAFSWYWQWKETDGLARLRARSLPPETSSDIIVKELVDRGLTADEATDLCNWLGNDARLLVERR
ncbi:MAG: hypothetical protein HOW73_32880 [Polyangiaceae bacterium]|nr:hypothetical protein [Polyangiaceae bacterium]